MNERTNTTVQADNQKESTYALLMRSEEKSRNLFEVVIYPLLILGPLIAIWQFAQQPVNIPVPGWKALVGLDAWARNNVCEGQFHPPGDQHPKIKG